MKVIKDRETGHVLGFSNDPEADGLSKDKYDICEAVLCDKCKQGWVEIQPIENNN